MCLELRLVEGKGCWGRGCFMLGWVSELLDNIVFRCLTLRFNFFCVFFYVCNFSIGEEGWGYGCRFWLS